MKKFFRFFISKQFLLNLAGIIVAWVILIWVVFASLKSHTNWNEEVAVPSFYGVHMDDLDLIVRDSEIDYEIQDSVYLEGWPKGTVCWQHPRPTDSTGMFVKEGRTILLSVVPLKPPMVAVPDLAGNMSKRMAETTLSSYGLKTKITYAPSPDGKGQVMEQKCNGRSIPAGTKVPKGTRIELVVSKGSSGEATALPNLVGLTIFEAQQRLLTLTVSPYFELDESVVTEEDRMKAIITNQSPAGGDNVTVAAGTTVTLWATKNTGVGN